MCLQRPIEPDHLGSPRKVIDPSRGVAVWDWPILGHAFGTAAANEDVDGDGVATTLNLRFPGQQYDAATGLHYNYFRDYDPATGRYVESDPIGLKAGMSTYGYVRGNVLMFFDLYGLSACGPACDCPCGWSMESGSTWEMGFGGFLSHQTAVMKCNCKRISCKTTQTCFGGGFKAGASMGVPVVGWKPGSSCRGLGSNGWSNQVSVDVGGHLGVGCSGEAPFAPSEGSVSCGMGLGGKAGPAFSACKTVVEYCSVDDERKEGYEL